MEDGDNRGFSFVELIVVIAVMATLMGVLMPQLLKYVESSRVQTDETLLSEVEGAVIRACSVSEVYDELPSGDVYATVTIQDGEKVTSDLAVLEEELRRTVPDTMTFTSAKYRAIGSETVSVTIDITRQMVVVTHSWD